MKLILASRKDPAAQNIAARLLEFYDFEGSQKNPDLYLRDDIALIQVPGGVTRMHELPLDAEEVIVASRHASETGKPTLTTHVPGEPSRHELAVAAPSTVKAALTELFAARDELGLPYDVSLEATHHGPTGLVVPVTFVEIGSSAEQWGDPKAGEAVARAVMAAAESSLEAVNAIGFGGAHYARRHTKVARETKVCTGHIFPKYLRLDEGLARAALKRTLGGVGVFALDWKGLRSEQRTRLMGIGKKLGVQVVRERDILSGKALI
jgi:D-aminoacyl-tRNA deacylase